MAMSWKESTEPMSDKIKVMRVRVEANGPEVIIPESRKDDLWAYCEDRIGKIEIRFASMTQEELDTLPEFEGF